MHKMIEDPVAEAVRVSHCANSDLKGHNCVGTCKITARGVELDCKLCGKAEAGLDASPEYSRLRSLLAVIKIDINLVDRESIGQMISHIRR